MINRKPLLTLVLSTALALTAASCSSGRQRADAAAAAPTTSTAGKVAPGMNAQGEVVDSAQVQAGSGQQIKGLDDWEGEITGKPAANSRFTKLQIGMSSRQVVDVLGPPDDQGAYITGKAFIPFYYGSDQSRYEFVYKGQGRLIFASGGMGSWSGGHLIWIIHNANERGSR